MDRRCGTGTSDLRRRAEEQRETFDGQAQDKRSQACGTQGRGTKDHHGDPRQVVNRRRKPGIDRAQARRQALDRQARDRRFEDFRRCKAGAQGPREAADDDAQAADSRRNFRQQLGGAVLEL